MTTSSMKAILTAPSKQNGKPIIIRWSHLAARHAKLASQSDTALQPPRAAACSRRSGIRRSSLFMLFGASIGGSRGVHPLAGHSKLPQYLWTMAWEWVLAGFVVSRRSQAHQAARPHRRPLGDNLEDVLLDVMIAAGFWLAAIVVLGVGAQADASRPGRQVRQHAPATRLPGSRHHSGTAGLVLRQHDGRLLRGDHLPRIPAAAVRRTHSFDAGGRCCCRRSSSARHMATKAARACC